MNGSQKIKDNYTNLLNLAQYNQRVYGYWNKE